MKNVCVTFLLEPFKITDNIKENINALVISLTHHH